MDVELDLGPDWEDEDELDPEDDEDEDDEDSFGLNQHPSLALARLIFDNPLANPFEGVEIDDFLDRLRVGMEDGVGLNPEMEDEDVYDHDFEWEYEDEEMDEDEEEEEDGEEDEDAEADEDEGRNVAESAGGAVEENNENADELDQL